MASQRKDRLDDPLFVTRLVWCLAIVCLLLAVADLFYAKQVEFGWESWPGFHGLFGFVAFFGLVLAGKHLRKVLMRGEDYYDR